MANESKAAVIFRCAQTGKETKSKTGRRPRGWKEIDGQTYSPDGWKELFVTRGLKLAIAWPREKSEQERLRNTMRLAAKQARKVVNWFMTTFYVLDQPSLNDEDKLHSFTVGSLYQKAKEFFPLDQGYTADLISAIENRTRSRYMSQRWEIAIGRRTLESIRNHPYVVRSASAKLYLEDVTIETPGKPPRVEQQPRLTVTICRERFNFVIAKTARKNTPGRDNSRQWNTLVSLLQKKLPYGELQFSTDARGNVFVVIVGLVPKTKGDNRSGTLYVKSDKDSLLLALNVKDEKIWAYHGDQLIGLKFAHRRKLNRFSDDTKAEDRPNPGFADTRRAVVKNYHNRLKTMMQQLVSRLVKHAARRKFATIEVDLSEQDFFPDFSWSGFETMLAAKCDQEGIEFVSKTEERQKAAKEAASQLQEALP